VSLFARQVYWASRVFNGIAAAAITGMMLLTCGDVLLRFLRRPIPGTYEMVGFLGSLGVSFALAHTSLERGHIAVDFLVQRLSEPLQRLVDGINALVCAVLFGLAAWHSLRYGMDLKAAGEVSMTLQLPVYPFVWGVAAGCGMLTVVLVMRAWGALLRLTTERP
jgi:TRAP-type C4-dicarboxylate transport system permease small subunit